MSTFRNLLFKKQSGAEWEGTPPLTLTGATSAPATDYKLYGKTVYGEDLSGEYTQLEYTQTVAGYVSSGAYLDTGVIPTINDEWHVVFSPVAKTTNGYFGSRSGTTTDSLWVHATTFSGGEQFAFAFTNGNAWSTNRNTVTVNNIYDVKCSNGSQTVNNTTYTETTLATTLTTTTNMLLGKAAAAADQSSAAKYYLVECKRNNVLIHRWIPVKRKSDNAIGMYDTVANTFIGSATGNPLVAGPAYTPQPTPEAPVELISVGDKTQNICDDSVYISAIFSSGKITTSTGRKIVWIPVTAGTTYTFSRSVVSDAASFTSVFTEEIPAVDVSYSIGGTSTFVNHKTTTGENIVGHRTAPAGAKYLAIGSYEGTDFMVVEGNLSEAQMPAYEKYGYKIPVKVATANLFDKDTITERYYLNSSGALVANAKWEVSDYMPVTGGASYYQKLNTPGQSPSTCWYDSTKTFISSSTQQAGGVLVAPANATYCRMSIWEDDLPIAMFVKGTTAPASYIPYYNTTTNIILSEPLRQVKSSDGTVKYTDYIDYGNQKIVRQVGYEEFNSESTFIHYSSVNGLFLSSIPLALLQSTAPFVGMCSHFAVKEATEVVSIDDLQCCFQTFSGSTVATFGLRYKAKVNPTNALKEWLGLQKANGTPVTIYYPLETATQTPVTLPSITLEGGATISVDTTVNASNLWIKQ